MNTRLVGVALEAIKSDSVHSHNEWEIILNLEGHGISYVNNEKYKFFPGMIMCIPPKILHTKYSEDNFKDIFIQTDNFPILRKNNILISKDDEEKSIQTLMFMALKAFHKKSKGYEELTDALNDVIQQLILSRINENSRNESVELFKNELIKNFTDPEFKVSCALEATNYSKDHFRRCFKESTGENPVSYLAALRIEYAKKLLMQKNNTAITISEIALNSGFYDSHYFSRIFKKITGKTPGEYAETN